MIASVTPELRRAARDEAARPARAAAPTREGRRRDGHDGAETHRVGVRHSCEVSSAQRRRARPPSSCRLHGVHDLLERLSRRSRLVSSVADERDENDEATQVTAPTQSRGSNRAHASAGAPMRGARRRRRRAAARSGSGVRVRALSCAAQSAAVPALGGCAEMMARRRTRRARCRRHSSRGGGDRSQGGLPCSTSARPLKPAIGRGLGRRAVACGRPGRVTQRLGVVPASTGAPAERAAERSRRRL